MTKETQDATGETQDNPQAAPGLPVAIHSQYIKDLSFENPNAPESLFPGQENPKMDVDINLNAEKIEHEKVENLYEIELLLKVKAERPEGTVFIVEMSYAAAVSLNGVPEDKHHPMLMAQIPHYIFPYARQILSEVVQQGGYPPLLLSPVNFRQMYFNRFGDAPSGDINEDVENNQKTA